MLLTLALIAILEAGPFNLRFWTSLSKPAPPDPLDVQTSLGPGLSHAGPGVLTVTDGSTDYVQVSGLDTTVDTLHVLTSEPTGVDSSAEQARPSQPDTDSPDIRGWVSARLQVLPIGSRTWHTGPEIAYDPDVPSTTYLRVDDSYGPVSAVRIWFLQPIGTSFQLGQVRVNERPGFQFSWLRVTLLLSVALFAIAFVDPRSGLYRVRFDTSVGWQFGLLLLMLVPLVVGAACALQSSESANLSTIFPPVYGNYTYDSDQYARLADALLHGHPWLDLTVPKELAAARNPYSLALRAQLLSSGVTPIFWDHAFWGGRWYCYFGVLPAILLYIPYELATGRGLSTPTAAMVLITLFAIWGTAFVSRVVQRHFPNSSLGMTLLSILGFLIGANTVFLLLRPVRPDFYATPLILSLALTSAGLWCWLGARRVVTGYRPIRSRDIVLTRAWRCTDGDPTGRFAPSGRLPKVGAITLSRPRLVIGTVLLTANIGSRPTFIFTVLLAFPIFWEEIGAGLFFSWLRPSFWKARRAHSSLGNDLSVLATGALATLPFLAYNYWRFGSFFDFGNSYQLTVTDLTNYSEPPDLMLPIAYYYLLQPPHFTRHFPFLGLVNTPLRAWQYTEPWMGGLVWLVPFTLLALAALCMRRTMVKRRMWPFVVSLFLLGLGICLFDSYLAGLSLRYLADFGWVFALLGLMGACGLESWARRSPGSSREVAVRLGCVRALVALLVLLGLGMTLLVFLVPGRVSDLLENMPDVYFSIRASLMNGIL